MDYAYLPEGRSDVSVFDTLRAGALQAKVDAMTKALVYLVDIAVAEAADTIVAEQKARAPKGTGALVNSIHKIKIGPLRYKITAGGLATTKGRYDYAIGQEFGNHHAPAQPFFYSGYRARKADAKKKIRTTINSELKKAVR